MSQFKIARRDTNGVTELAEGVSLIPLGLIEAMTLIEHLGFDPSFTEHSVHVWYGDAIMEGAITLSRPFTLSVDRWGTAVVAIDTRTLGRLFPRALAALLPPLEEMIIAIPCR